MWLVVSMNKEMSRRFKERQATFEEAEVRMGNQIDPAASPVRVEGRDAAAIHPESEVVFSISGMQHHLIMISEDGYKSAAIRQSDQLIENVLRIDAAVDVIAQRDNRVIRRRIDGIQQALQGH